MPTPLEDFNDLPAIPELEGSPVNVAGCTVSSNLIRITASGHGLVNDDLCYIYGVLGTVTANGTWAVTRIDNNIINLQNSRWAGHSYSSGGFVQKINTRFMDQWDGYSLREVLDCEPITAPTTTETTSTDRMANRFTQYAINGKQVFRNPSGVWHVLTEGINTNYLSTASGDVTNFLKPRGGDFTTTRLTGISAPYSILASGGRSASGLSKSDGSLHVIYHGTTATQVGINYTSYNGSSWSTPLNVSGYTSMRNSDIMLNADDEVVIAHYDATKVYYTQVTNDPSPAIVSHQEVATITSRDNGTANANETALQDVCMTLGPDGKVYMAYRHHFAIYVVVRETNGTWGTPTKVAYEYCWYPSIFIANGEPMIIFQHESKRKIPRDISGDFTTRRGEKCNIGYAIFRDGDWHCGTIVSAEEITDNRRGIFNDLETGDQFPMIEQFGVPTVSLDQYGIPTVYWPNLTRRWVYSSRWMGDRWSDPLDIRGPFLDLKRPLMIERQVPTGKTDVGLLVWAACDGGTHRAIFDRIHTGAIDPTSENRILFLDETEITTTSGVTFNLNQCQKIKNLPSVPVSGSQETLFPLEIRAYDSEVTIRYNEDGNTRYARSVDGVDFEYGLTSAPTSYSSGVDSSDTELCAAFDIEVSEKAPLFLNGVDYFLNPNTLNPSTHKYVRFHYDSAGASGWGSHSYEFGIDDGPNIAWSGVEVDLEILKIMREGNSPQCNDPDDPEGPIRIYSRVYDNTGRTWGVLSSSKTSAINWHGLSHHLEVDSPYVTNPEAPEIHSSGDPYSARARIYLSSLSGKGEDQIYEAAVSYSNGLWWAFYFAGQPSIPLSDMRLAVSRDGRNFFRVKSGNKVLKIGEPGEFDSGYIFSSVVCEDEENKLLRVAYRGTPAVRDGTDAYEHNRTEIGHATMRSWGFTYYTTDSEGSVTTGLFDITDSRGLYINAEGMTYRGDLYIDLLNTSGNVITGFGDGCPIQIDNPVDNPVSWNGVTELPEESMKIRFKIKNGVKLYSFRFDTPETPSSTLFRRQPLNRELQAL